MLLIEHPKKECILGCFIIIKNVIEYLQNLKNS